MASNRGVILDGRGRAATANPETILSKGRELLADLRKELKDCTRDNDSRQERENNGYFNASTLFQQFPQVPYQSTTVSGPK